jgi:hypothetical protein
MIAVAFASSDKRSVLSINLSPPLLQRTVSHPHKLLNTSLKKLQINSITIFIYLDVNYLQDASEVHLHIGLQFIVLYVLFKRFWTQLKSVIGFCLNKVLNTSLKKLQTNFITICIYQNVNYLQDVSQAHLCIGVQFIVLYVLFNRFWTQLKRVIGFCLNKILNRSVTVYR